MSRIGAGAWRAAIRSRVGAPRILLAVAVEIAARAAS